MWLSSFLGCGYLHFLDVVIFIYCMGLSSFIDRVINTDFGMEVDPYPRIGGVHMGGVIRYKIGDLYKTL